MCLVHGEDEAEDDDDPDTSVMDLVEVDIVEVEGGDEDGVLNDAEDEDYEDRVHIDQQVERLNRAYYSRTTKQQVQIPRPRGRDDGDVEDHLRESTHHAQMDEGLLGDEQYG